MEKKIQWNLPFNRNLYISYMNREVKGRKSEIHLSELTVLVSVNRGNSIRQSTNVRILQQRQHQKSVNHLDYLSDHSNLKQKITVQRV